MFLNVTFAESSRELNANVGENQLSLDTNMGNFMVVHDGQNGATFYPNVSNDGVLSWTNDRELENPTPVNIKGDKGEKGEKGDQGDKGDTGTAGKDGMNGKDGYTPIKGVDYFDGKDGSNGADGKTPVKGVDYYTDADKAEMVSAVLAALPVYNGEVVSI